VAAWTGLREGRSLKLIELKVSIEFRQSVPNSIKTRTIVSRMRKKEGKAGSIAFYLSAMVLEL